MDKKPPFSFNISLSVINHLGRNLYRSFVTVLGEAISNSWDADAKNVWIYIDKEKDNFVIKDDGMGMSESDFQQKFLKVGYSKRKDGENKSPGGRPYIGRKGIGKLALLSCARKVKIVSKSKSTEYVGGCIDNTNLDQAISEDSNEYKLEKIKHDDFDSYKEGCEQGTIIRFEKINEGIKHSLEYLKKIIALYFRFSLLDDSFSIYLNDEKITEEHLKELAEKTEFLWNINTLDDPYIKNELTEKKEDNLLIISEINVEGFVATVEKPRYLKVIKSEEKVGIDLFVNGRLREKNIIKHMPGFSTRHIASYLYGQIHYNDLDGDSIDRFTSSRESIVSGDEKYSKFLKIFEKTLGKISDEWDVWRLKHKEEGDPENTKRMSLKERKAKTLVEEISKEFSPPKTSKNKIKVDRWIDELDEDARFNVQSYIDCFMSENLIRKYIQEHSIPLSQESKNEIDKWKQREEDAKNYGNISIDIMEYPEDTNYLSMDGVANLLDKKDAAKFASLSRDAKEYKPMRNAVAHTARLTQMAKDRLNLVYENIKGRIKTLLFTDDEEE